jgi:hypothetical protein
VGVAQVVEILPSKCKALSSNPRTTKKEDQKKHWPKTSQILSGLYNSWYMILNNSKGDQAKKNIWDTWQSNCHKVQNRESWKELQERDLLHTKEPS